MEQVQTKTVIVADETLPAGLLANTAAILGVTLGKCLPECVGEDVQDASGLWHKGIVLNPIPILKGNRELIKSLRAKLFGEAYDDVTVVDFSDVAQSCVVYSDYTAKARKTTESDHNYLGIAIHGSKKKVNSLTGSLPLYRKHGVFIDTVLFTNIRLKVYNTILR